ncbi:hypothetical protein E4U49_006415, partial [Claviceps purpurea]
PKRMWALPGSPRESGLGSRHTDIVRPNSPFLAVPHPKPSTRAFSHIVVESHRQLLSDLVRLLVLHSLQLEPGRQITVVTMWAPMATIAPTSRSLSPTSRSVIYGLLRFFLKRWLSFPLLSCPLRIRMTVEVLLGVFTWHIGHLVRVSGIESGHVELAPEIDLSVSSSKI